MTRGRGFAVSTAQRSKAKQEGTCRVCKREGVDPAHVTPRSVGGCHDPECVIALCRSCHGRYDRQQYPWLDVLPLLTTAEQAHAVSHLGIVGALERTTNIGWLPETNAAA